MYLRPRRATAATDSSWCTSTAPLGENQLSQMFPRICTEAGTCRPCTNHTAWEAQTVGGGTGGAEHHGRLILYTNIHRLFYYLSCLNRPKTFLSGFKRDWRPSTSTLLSHWWLNRRNTQIHTQWCWPVVMCIGSGSLCVFMCCLATVQCSQSQTNS